MRRSWPRTVLTPGGSHGVCVGPVVFAAMWGFCAGRTGQAARRGPWWCRWLANATPGSVRRYPCRGVGVPEVRVAGEGGR